MYTIGQEVELNIMYGNACAYSLLLERLGGGVAEDWEFKANLGNTGRLCQKQRNKTKAKSPKLKTSVLFAGMNLKKPV